MITTLCGGTMARNTALQNHLAVTVKFCQGTCVPWARDSRFSLSLFCLKPKTRRAAGDTHPQAPITVSWPTSASQGSVIFLESLSEKQMTDALFELCNQEQAGVTNCSVYWTSFYIPSSTSGNVIASSVMFIAKKINPLEQKMTEVHIIIDNIASIIQVHSSFLLGAVLRNRKNV